MTSTSEQLFDYYRDAFVAWANGDGTNPAFPERPVVSGTRNNLIYNRAMRSASEAMVFGAGFSAPPAASGEAMAPRSERERAYAEYFGIIGADGQIYTIGEDGNYAPERPKIDVNEDGRVREGGDSLTLQGNQIEAYAQALEAAGTVYGVLMHTASGSTEGVPSAELRRIDPERVLPGNNVTARQAVYARTLFEGSRADRGEITRGIATNSTDLSYTVTRGAITVRLMDGGGWISGEYRRTAIGDDIKLPDNSIDESYLPQAFRDRVLEPAIQATLTAPASLTEANAQAVYTTADTYAAVIAQRTLLINSLSGQARTDAVAYFERVDDWSNATQVTPPERPTIANNASILDFARRSARAREGFVNALAGSGSVPPISRTEAGLAADNIVSASNSAVGSATGTLPETFDSVEERRAIVRPSIAAVSGLSDNAALIESQSGYAPERPDTSTQVSTRLRDYAQTYASYVDLVRAADTAGALSTLSAQQIQQLVEGSYALRGAEGESGINATDGVSLAELREIWPRLHGGEDLPAALNTDGAATAFSEIVRLRRADTLINPTQGELSGVNESVFDTIRARLDARLTGATVSIDAAVRAGIAEQPDLTGAADHGDGGPDEGSSTHPRHVTSAYAETRGTLTNAQVVSIQTLCNALGVPANSEDRSFGALSDGVDGIWGGATEAAFASACALFDPALDPTTATPEQFEEAALRYLESQCSTALEIAAATTNYQGAANSEVRNIALTSENLGTTGRTINIDLGEGRDIARIMLGAGVTMGQFQDTNSDGVNDALTVTSSGQSFTINFVNVEASAVLGVASPPGGGAAAPQEIRSAFTARV